jgi:uncharacterized protein (TIGR01319 family)
MVILTADIGSTYTKLTAVDAEREDIIATASSFTTIETDVMDGFNAALDKLKQKVAGFRFDKLYCCSSAAGGLKMVALGLVPELTAKAARLAAASAGAKVVKTYSFEISQSEIKEIESISPDLILLCGGTDGGNKEVIIANAAHLCKINLPFSIIVAGNKSASGEVAEILSNAGKSFVITDNVMPEFNRLNIEPAKKRITELFISRIIEAKGLDNIQKLADADIIPTPLAVLNACDLLSKGTPSVQGIGDLMAVDLGGATTDVYSIADGKPTLENVTVKGLPEPFSKRTVEGDLGMRYSMHALVDQIEWSSFVDETGLSEESVISWLHTVSVNPSTIATPSSEEEKIEQAVARMAVKLAVERHCGHYQPVFTPFGQVFALTGKDLASVPNLIGVGGAIINSPNPAQILNGAVGQAGDYVFAKPQNPAVKIDSDYIFASMGLLSSFYADMALRILKKRMVDV